MELRLPSALAMAQREPISPNVRSAILMIALPIVTGLRLLAAPFFLALCLAIPAAAAEETPRLRAWWAFQQRAYPVGHIPAGAQMRALQQTLDARAAQSAAAEESDRWINIGPAPIVDTRPVSGRVAAIAIDPRDRQHWLIGAAQGGIWETRDAGTTWTAKTDAAPSLAIGSIAFAPSNPDVIYA